MELSVIFSREATLEDLIELHEKEGYEFVISDGYISEVIC